MPWIPPTFWKDKNIWAQALIPASLLYGRIQKTLYNSRAPYKSSLPVICIGNVQLGGSGKTPITQALYRLMLDHGLAKNPVILLRGYGGDMKGPVFVSPDTHSAKDVGDEALLHAQYAPTIVSRNRAEGARLAEANGYDFILMDDGLQNNHLAKTLSYLVFNTDQGLGNKLTFPAGPLREVLPEALNKVSGIMCVGHELPFETDLPIHSCRIIAPIADNPNKPYVAFCGIGQPDKFLYTLQTHHYHLVDFVPFADHQPYTESMMGTLREQAAAQNATLLTTEKDYMRLPVEWRDGIEVLKITYQFDRPDAIIEQIKQALSA